MNNIKETVECLKKSKFRSKFHLSNKDKKYIDEKGIDIIKNHAYDLINTRLAPLIINNDGKQTPMHGHPVFVAQHATATCCRNCLYKWHKIPKNKQLSDTEINYIVELILFWIIDEIKYNNN